MKIMGVKLLDSEIKAEPRIDSPGCVPPASPRLFTNTVTSKSRSWSVLAIIESRNSRSIHSDMRNRHLQVSYNDGQVSRVIQPFGPVSSAEMYLMAKSKALTPQGRNPRIGW